MGISAIVLDLGNVLVFHDNVRLFAEMAKRFHTTPDALRSRLDGGLWDQVNRGQLPGDNLRQELVARLSVEVTEDEFFALWSCHFQVNDEMVREVERWVGQKRLVLLSNTHDLHVKWVRQQMPLLDRFDALVLSCEVGAVKPERKIYERALAAANVPAEEAVFFDDVERFAQGAEQVGMHGRVFTGVERFRQDLKALL